MSRGETSRSEGGCAPLLGFWAGFCPVVLIFCLKPVTALVYAVRLWITLGLARARVFLNLLNLFSFSRSASPC